MRRKNIIIINYQIEIGIDRMFALLLLFEILIGVSITIKKGFFDKKTIIPLCFLFTVINYFIMFM